LIKPLLAGIGALIAASAANADVVVHLTGSTAFRASTIVAVENIMGGPGNFKGAYMSATASGEQGATYVVLQGSVASVPAAGLVTVKCTWTGSTGGIKSVVQNIDITQTTAPNGWMSITNLPGTNTVINVASPSFALDTGAFPGETLKPDVTMEDSLQASTGFVTTTLTETKVGVIAFEWVANNGSPAVLDNITPLIAQALLSGGTLLSHFTGNPAHAGTAVYAVGRDFDSGTRLSELAETGVGVFGSVQQIQPTISGTAGAAGSSVTKLKLWPAATVLGQPFAIGQSGFASGGTLADNMATPGSPTATSDPGADQPLLAQLGFVGGHLIGYLGRNDAARAVKTNVIASNTAHRLKWNGVADWNGNTFNPDGTPTGGYNDAVIQNGLYSAWEYEFLAYRSTFAGNGKAVADKIANEILNTTATVAGIKLSTMNVSKQVEGGVITY